MASHVLVTGAPGWAGTRLVDALAGHSPLEPDLVEPGPRVRCLVQPGMDGRRLGDPARVDGVVGDLRDPAACEALCRGGEGATLFHCAGLIHPARRVREVFEVNVEGTRNLLRAAERAGVRRVVALSSNSVAGANASRQQRFDEESPFSPYRAYGRSKMLMEQEVAASACRGMEAVILRPTWFYGPGQPERQTRFFRMIRRGKAPIAGDGGNLRSLAYVDSLCQAMLLAARTEGAAGRTYWIADERPYSMNEIVDTVEGLMERELGLEVAHRRLRVPSLACAVAGVADGIIQAAGLYQQELHVLSEMDKTIACSVERAKRELGYRPIVSLEEGMRRSLLWCREQGIEL